MMFVRKQAGLLRSARSWGVLGLVLALAVAFGSDSVTPAQSVTVNAVITVDNVYKLCHGPASPGTITCVGADDNFITVETYTLSPSATDYIYIAAWSDDTFLQGFLGQFSSRSTTIRTGDPGFDVCATGQDLDTLAQQPSPAALATAINQCNTASGWVNPVVGQTAPWLWAGIVGFDPAASGPSAELNKFTPPFPKWIWHDAGQAAQVQIGTGNPAWYGCNGSDRPFNDGCNHQEYLIFRLPVTLLTGGGQTACVQPPSGLVEWWSLDETSGNVVNNLISHPIPGHGPDLHNGTPQPGPIGGGGPVPSAGMVANALQFGGVNDFVEVPDPSGTLSHQAPNSFTIDAWIKVDPGDASGIRPIVDKRVEIGGKVAGYAFFLSNGQLGFQLADGVGPSNICGAPGDATTSCTNYVSTANVADGKWHFVAAVIDRTTNQIRLYDGPAGGSLSLVLTGQARPNAANNAALLIGSGYPIVISKPFFKGAIDEVEIFNRALSEDEIKSIFNSGSAGKCKPTLLPDLTVNKQVMCSGPVTPQGIKCTITFTITNNGPGTFNGILVINDTVTPPPSPGISWAGPSTPAGWNCAISPPNSIGCSSAAPGGAPASVTLGPTGSTTFSVDVYIPNGQYKNCVEVKGYTQFPYTPSTLIQEVTFANNQHCVDFQSGELKKCDLEISKSLAHGIVPPLQPGQQVTFEIIVTNVGTGPCDPPIPVTDTFTGMTYQSGGQIMGPWTCPPGSSATPVTCNYSGTSATPLQPGQSSNFFVNFTVTAKPGEAVENCAEVKHPNDTNPNNNKACIKVPVAEPKEKCDLKITKTVQPNPVPSGQQVTVTLTVQNVGTGPCGPDTVVQDPPTTGLTVPSQQVGVSQSGGTATWGCLILGGGVNCVTASTLPVGYTATFTFTATVTVAPPPGGVANIQNCATVNNPNDPLNPANPGNNQSCVTLQVQGVGNPMDLALVKLLDGQIRVEQEATYVLRVTNVGGRPTTGPIVVSDPLPSGLRFVSASGPGWSCAAQGQNVTCRNAGPIQPGQTSTILLRVRVAAPAGTQITNCATVETAGDANPANNRACHTGTVQR
jgi:uncharacterized repeat protein (TIGR01451 family)